MSRKSDNIAVYTVTALLLLILAVAAISSDPENTQTLPLLEDTTTKQAPTNQPKQTLPPTEEQRIRAGPAPKPNREVLVDQKIREENKSLHTKLTKANERIAGLERELLTFLQTRSAQNFAADLGISEVDLNPIFSSNPLINGHANLHKAKQSMPSHQIVKAIDLTKEFVSRYVAKMNECKDPDQKVRQQHQNDIVTPWFETYFGVLHGQLRSLNVPEEMITSLKKEL